MSLNSPDAAKYIDAHPQDPLWGIDLGGTKIECVVLKSAREPEVIHRHRIPTEGHIGYDHILTRIKCLIDDVATVVGFTPSRIGIGTPGSIDPQTELLRGSNSQNLQNRAIQKDLTTILDIEVKVENDANCFALAETRMGAVSHLHKTSLPIQGRSPSDLIVFGIIMGTGVGGGLVVHNKLIKGCNGITGEWGHNYLDSSGGPCYCGKTGCVETIISGPALERYYREKTGNDTKLAEINQLAENGDQYAQETMQRLVHFSAIGISSIINMIDPDVIVIGGGVGNLDILYKKGPEEIAKFVFNPTMTTIITRPAMGDSAGVFGAAFLFE